MNKSAIAAYKVFLQKGCSFAKEIENQCKVSRDSSYRAIKKLEMLNLVHKLSKINIRKASGTKPTLYGLEDVSEEEIQDGVARYKKTRSKVYTYVDIVYQKTLPEVEEEFIQYQKIMYWARQHGNNGFHIRFIADEVARLLSTQGVKVLRNV